MKNNYLRLALMIILISTAIQLFGQNGYVKLDEDSTMTGFLRSYVSIKDGHQGIEVWRTKTDKAPVRIPKGAISEYAIKKDTFKILTQFRPFVSTHTYFELVEAKLKSSGKVNLYVIENYRNANRISTYTGGGLIPAIIDESLGNHTYMYLLEDKATGYLRALPSKPEALKESLMDFFSERYISKYAELKGKITYKTIPALVKLYNSK